MFVWREGGDIRREQRLWVRPRRTAPGYCVMRFLLPHGAETATDIVVEGKTVDRVLAGVPPMFLSYYQPWGLLSSPTPIVGVEWAPTTMNVSREAVKQ